MSGHSVQGVRNRCLMQEVMIILRQCSEQGVERSHTTAAASELACGAGRRGGCAGGA